MKAVFYGTPAEAVPSLEALAAMADVVLVTTRPDRSRGRSGRPQAPPVKEAALALGLPLAQPERAAHDLERLRSLAPEVAVVVAYGQLLPAALLAVPAAGFLNVHFSLLPRWRGASPVVRTLLAGDPVTGVTLMVLDEGMDTGP
ncbi:MAG TPA: formyltransferase family protein, partial [Acidimicrobiia bacterium]|nr:formyltransferase family protein [Acidimicrobiia bacterium]